MMKFRRISRLLVVSTAVAAVVVLAGCPRAVNTPVSFAAGDITLAVPAMVTGTAISAITLPEATGGEGAFTYALAPDVPGLTFDPASRQLSGTPTVAASYLLSYTATDAAGATATLSFSVTVRPTLWGTWTAATGIWDDDGEILGTFADALTFTNSRYIFARMHYRTDGSFDHAWAPSGTWAATDDTITRTWYHNHDDDDETPEVLTSFDKEYLFADDAHTVLFVHYWESDHIEDRFMRLDRMSNVSPLAVVGVWKFFREEDDGTEVFTISVDADGTFSYSHESTGGTWTMTAEWHLDEAEYFLNLTDARATWTETGEAPEPARLPGADRFAFAPTTEWPNSIVVSPFWHETLGYDHDRDLETGDYWMQLQRQ